MIVSHDNVHDNDNYCNNHFDNSENATQNRINNDNDSNDNIYIYVYIYIYTLQMPDAPCMEYLPTFTPNMIQM